MKKEENYTYLIDKALELLKLRGISIADVAKEINMPVVKLYSLRRHQRAGKKEEWDLIVERFGNLIEEVVQEAEQINLVKEDNQEYQNKVMLKSLQEIVESQRIVIEDLRKMIKERDQMIDKLREENEALKKLLRQ